MLALNLIIKTSLETWWGYSEIINSSYFDIINYKATPFERKANKGRGSILIYMKVDLIYKGPVRR